MTCTTCNDAGHVPASAAAIVDGTDHDGTEPCPDCNPWRPDFGPLTNYLARCVAAGTADAVAALPWEYMGHDAHGLAHYRERSLDTRLALAADGTPRAAA